MRVLLAAGLAAAMLATDDPGQFDLYGLGAAVHLRHQDRDCRDVNPGGGIGGSQPCGSHDWFLIALAYRDSNDLHAVGVAGGYREVFGDRDRWHANAGVAVGALQGSGYHGLAALPILGVGYSHWHLETALLPTAVAAGFWLRYSWVLAP